MPIRRPIAWLMLAVLLFAAPSCVDLTEQRITWFYDQAADVLYVLIHYDGIHEGKGHGQPDGATQLREFVANGDVLFFDWPLHIQMKELRKRAADRGGLTKDAVGWLMSGVQVQVLGHYREPDGRIGGAQLLTIPRASKFVRECNRLLDRWILTSDDLRDQLCAGSPRTEARLRKAAEAGHRWVALDGHALRLSFPIDAAEWTRFKTMFLAEVLPELIESQKRDRDDDGILGWYLSAVGSAPASYVEEHDKVTFVIGLRDRPVTLRVPVHDKYESSLEDVVIECAKTDLDSFVGRALLSNRVDRPRWLEQMLRWGPPEERVRALLTIVKRGEEPAAAAARKHLVAFGGRWNREVGLPTAPSADTDRAAVLKGWANWYVRVKRPGAKVPESARQPRRRSETKDETKPGG